MDILITGGTGFIGQALIPELLNLGHRVSVYSRNPARAEKILPLECHFVSHLTADSLQFQPEAVINLAGAPIADKRWSAARKKMIRESRVVLTEQLVSLCQKLDSPPATWINASAVGFYGAQGDTLVKEDTTPVEEFTHELCRDWELAARVMEKSGTRVCLARLGLVMGKGGFLKRLWLPFSLGLGGKLGDGSQWMPWVHRQDVVQIFLQLLRDEKLSGPFNVVSPNPVTNAEFTRKMGKRLGRPTFFTVPAFILRLGLGEMSQLLLTGQRAVPDRLLREGGTVFLYSDLAEALKTVEM